jgi:hypothetical protein
MSIKKALIALCSVVSFALSASAQVDSNFHCYLLFGQSNMAGGGAISDSAADCDTSPRVKVLAFSDCNLDKGPDCKNSPVKRTHDQWYTAQPPLHDCSPTLEGISPGDWFGKTMLDSVADFVKIGLIPCALSGMSLDVFLKNGSAKSTVGPTAVNGKNAYNWLISRCQIAQKTGVIKGFLLHQGESGTGNSTNLAWDDLAIKIFNDLKTDLKLDAKTPAVVAQLRSDNTAPAPQYNAGTNNLIINLPKKYANSAAVSSTGLVGNGKDIWHFNPSSMRELGRRYARSLLSIADNKFIPRKGSVFVKSPKIQRAIYSQSLKSLNESVRIYSLNGKMVSQCSNNDQNALKGLQPGSIYIVKRNSGTSAQLLMLAR